ncbi:hypothetical protein CAY57_10095 [Heyndrickxia coagulans]|nr:hypothetical protein CAY57_10095 [Heyndrickxia coagulans]
MGHKVKVPVQLTRVIATYWGRVIRRPKLKFLAKCAMSGRSCKIRINRAGTHHLPGPDLKKFFVASLPDL